MRALLLIIGLVVAGVFLLWLALKIAGAAIHLMLWVGLILVAAAVIAVAMRRFRRRH